MTGRRLYEIVTDEVRRSRAVLRSSYFDGSVARGNFEDSVPPAWAFLLKFEQDAWNAAAKRAGGRR